MSKGDFHNGIPDRHPGNKGDHTDDVRSSAEQRKSEAGQLNRDPKKPTDLHRGGKLNKGN